MFTFILQGAQTENLPYVYYTPSYGYSQSPYNPYNPYIPGAILGVDGPFVGTQQYYTIPSYENPASSPSYVPMVVQSRPDISSNSTTDLFIDKAASTANRVDGRGLKHNLSPSSETLTRGASNQTSSFNRVSDGSKANAGPSKQPASSASAQALQVPFLA